MTEHEVEATIQAGPKCWEIPDWDAPALQSGASKLSKCMGGERGAKCGQPPDQSDVEEISQIIITTPPFLRPEDPNGTVQNMETNRILGQLETLLPEAGGVDDRTADAILEDLRNRGLLKTENA